MPPIVSQGARSPLADYRSHHKQQRNKRLYNQRNIPKSRTYGCQGKGHRRDLVSIAVAQESTEKIRVQRCSSYDKYNWHDNAVVKKINQLSPRLVETRAPLMPTGICLIVKLETINMVLPSPIHSAIKPPDDNAGRDQREEGPEILLEKSTIKNGHSRDHNDGSKGHPKRPQG